jgi:hypothetical protein
VKVQNSIDNKMYAGSGTAGVAVIAEVYAGTASWLWLYKRARPKLWMEM